MACLTKEAVTALNQTLRLPATGREQDWDIELADPDRVDEFVAYAENHVLSGGESYALMALILGSLEDLAHTEAVSSALWDKVARLLRADPGLYQQPFAPPLTSLRAAFAAWQSRGRQHGARPPGLPRRYAPRNDGRNGPCKRPLVLYAGLMEQWGPKSDDPDGFAISPLLQSL